MKIKFFLLIAIQVISFSFTGFSQYESVKDGDLKSQADRYFFEENYKAAFPLCSELYKRFPENPLVNFYLGVCYLNVAPDRKKGIDKAKAIPHLETAYKTLPIMDVTYYLARAYHLDSRFEKAIQFYKSYIDSLEKSEPVFLAPFLENKDEISVLEHQVEMCRNGIKFAGETPSRIIFENLGEPVNSSFAEYAPAVSADNEVLVFTSRRPSEKFKKTDIDDTPYEDIYISYKKEGRWLPAVPISENVNTKRHDASVGLSSDAQTLFIYYRGDIYLSELKGNFWTKPGKMDPPINTSSWETHISMTSSQNSVYFVSDRPGGYGGRDIYTAKKQKDGKWGDIKNLGTTINTPWDEEAPFIHPDERHLYFSSNGHNSMGGFDIFYSELKDGQWSAPENLKPPINTPDDDIYFNVSSNGKSGYIATIREDGFGDKDIYTAKMPETGEVPLTVVRGIIRGDDGQPVHSRFSVKDKSTGELVGIYHSNSASGKYLLVFPPGKEYDIIIAADGYLPHSEDVKIPPQNRFYDLFQEIQLASVERRNPPPGTDTVAGQRIVMRNAFFDIEKAVEIADPQLHRAEVKELAYSAFISDYEKSPDKNKILERLDTIKEISAPLKDYKPEIQVHIAGKSEKEKLIMEIAGFDTIYALSEESPALVKLPFMDSIEFTIPPLYYTSRTEADTARFRPEQYLALKRADTLFASLPLPPPEKPAEQLSLNEFNQKLEKIEKITTLEKQVEEKKPEIIVSEKTKPEEVKPAETKPVKTEPIETKPSETKPVSISPLAETLKEKPVVLNNILFEVNKSNLLPESYNELDKAVEILKKNSSLYLEVSGHTDSTGKESFNLVLSEKRGQSVVRYFTGRGLAGSRFTVKGFGESRPVADNGSEEGRKKNRRVELSITDIVLSEPSAVIAGPDDISIDNISVCKEVVNLSPVEAGTSFIAGTGHLYCFTEVMSPAGTDTYILHRWYFNNRQVAEIKLPVRGPRWRTYSRKTIPAGNTGNWKVEIITSGNKILHTLNVIVE
ncbi:MAG: DUF2914 domain-containing protein [Bacteroidetes bacterium]|nr:DUF2914 domain-containing protein [Bacteroidota bacterium]